VTLEKAENEQYRCEKMTTDHILKKGYKNDVKNGGGASKNQYQ